MWYMHAGVVASWNGVSSSRQFGGHVCAPCRPTALLLLGVCMCQCGALQCTVLNVYVPHTDSCARPVCHCMLVGRSSGCDVSLNMLEDVRAHFCCSSNCDHAACRPAHADQPLCLLVGYAAVRSSCSAADTQSLHSRNAVATQLLHCCVGCLAVCHCVGMHLLWCGPGWAGQVLEHGCIVRPCACEQGSLSRDTQPAPHLQLCLPASVCCYRCDMVC